MTIGLFIEGQLTFSTCQICCEDDSMVTMKVMLPYWSIYSVDLSQDATDIHEKRQMNVCGSPLAFGKTLRKLFPKYCTIDAKSVFSELLGLWSSCGVCQGFQSILSVAHSWCRYPSMDSLSSGVLLRAVSCWQHHHRWLPHLCRAASIPEHVHVKETIS